MAVIDYPVHEVSTDNNFARKEEFAMKVIKKNSVEKALKELKTRALACEPHSMCPKCLKGKG